MRTARRIRSVMARAATAMMALALGGGAGALLAPGAARAETVREYQDWYLSALKLSQAHKITKGEGVVVAVIDSGVDDSLPDLRGQVLPGRGIGSDAAPDGRRDADAKVGHGTGMAGIIAGKGGGADHVLGIAPKARILPVSLGKVNDSAEVVEGIRWAADHGADVINLSLGHQGPPGPAEIEAARYAMSKGAVLVAAAGNRSQGDTIVASPASIPGVIAVSATTKSGAFWSGSVQGPEMVLGSPGEQIIFPVPSAVSDLGYQLSSSTSGATAVLSGAVALVRARYPDLDAANVINRLISTADDRGADGRDPQYGFGTVDLMAALTESVPKVTANPLLAKGGQGRPDAGRSEPGRDGNGPGITIGNKGSGLSLALQVGFVALLMVIVVVLVLVNRRARHRRLAAATPGPVGGGARQWGGPPPPGAPPRPQWAGQHGVPPPWPGQPAPPSPGYPGAQQAQPGYPGAQQAQPGHPAPPHGAQPPPGPAWPPPAPPPGGGRG